MKTKFVGIVSLALALCACATTNARRLGSATFAPIPQLTNDLGGTAPAPQVVAAGNGVVGFNNGLTATNKSTAGAINTANAVTAVASRNAGNTADITLLRTDSSNDVLLGDLTNATGINLQLATGANAFTLQSPAHYFQVFPASALMQWDPSSTGLTLNQANLTTASGTGGSFTLQAQNETGTTSTGGALNLTTGTGTSTNGALNLQVGATTTITLADTGGIQLPGPSIALSSGTVTLTFAQYRFVYQTYTGTLTAAQTVVYPNSVALWFADISQVAGISGTNTLTFKSGSGSCTAITALNTTAQVAMIVGTGSNGCRINI